MWQDNSNAEFNYSIESIPDPFHDNFRQRVYQIMATIPYDRLTIYGDAACLASVPHAARQVGGLLSWLPEKRNSPWHRVVNRHRTISLSGEDFYQQLRVLQAEGLFLQDSGLFDSPAAGDIQKKALKRRQPPLALTSSPRDEIDCLTALSLMGLHNPVGLIPPPW